MKNTRKIQLTACLALGICLSANAQEKIAKTVKAIDKSSLQNVQVINKTAKLTQADIDAIKSTLEGVDPSLYSIDLTGGTSKVASGSAKLANLKQVSTVKPAGKVGNAAAEIVIWDSYRVTVWHKDALENLSLKAKVDKVNTILNKAAGR